MNIDPSAERAALIFLERFWADRDAQKQTRLAEYLALFPECEEIVAREYLAALLEARGDRTDDAVETDDDRVGPYRLLRELGRGGQGIVWLAEDTRLGRKVALKVLTGLGPGAEAQLARFKREAALASKLEHPGICGVHDTGIEGGLPYIAMRYVDGETLSDRLARLRSATAAEEMSSFASFEDDDGPAAPGEPTSSSSSSIDRAELDRIIAAFAKIADALHAAHEVGIIHRDIKPGNIMVTADNEPVILDFGLARDDSDDAGPSLTETGDLFGTPAYMSPEQITGRRVRLDRRSDVYSLAVTLYECLTMKRPFEAPTRESLYQAILSKTPERPRKLNRAIPADLDVVLQCAMDKDRDRRYQTAADLSDDLRRVLSGRPIRAKRISTVGRAWRWAKRRPAAAALIVALSLGIPTVSGLSVWYWTHRDDVAEQERLRIAELVEDQLEIGFYEMHHGVKTVAVTAFEHALSLDPTSAEAAVGLALTHLELKSPETALQVLERAVVAPGVLARTKARVLEALGRQPEAATVLAGAPEIKGALMWFLEGQNAMLEGHRQGLATPAGKATFAKAEDLFLRAVQASPRVRRAYHFDLAHAAGHCESPRACAIADANEMLWPESHSAWLWIGLARWDEPARRVAAYREAIRLRPDYAAAHSNLGGTLYRQGKIEEAISALQEAIRLEPDHAAAHNDLGNVLAFQGKLDEAVIEFRETIRVKPDAAYARINLGRVLMQQGKLDESVSAFREGLELNPEDPESHGNLANVLMRQGKFEEAISALQEGIRLKPDHPGLHYNLGTILSRQGRLEQGIIELREAVRLKPDHAFAHCNLGLALGRQGKLKEAILALRKALHIDPGCVPARTVLDQLLRAAPAVAALREDVSRNPEDPIKLNALAWMLVDPKGDASIRAPKEALALARRAVALTQRKNAANLDTLAVALAANRDFKGAAAVQEELLRLMNGKSVSGMTVADAEAALKRYHALSKEGEAKEGKQNR